jgi:hypothetical protein
MTVTVVDLIGPSKDAIFAALAAAVPTDLAKVLDVIPEGTVPNFVAIGAIDAEPDLSINEQLEKITVEIQYVYRGQDRDVLIEMMRVGRLAIDQQQLTGVGVAFCVARCAHSTLGTAAADGVTFAGIQNFLFWAQPAD